MSFQSLMRHTLTRWESSYSVNWNTALAPQSSSSRIASRIVTSPCARWFSSFKASAFWMISLEAVKISRKVSFSSVMPRGIFSKRNKSSQWSWDSGSPRTHLSTGSTSWKGTVSFVKPRLYQANIRKILIAQKVTLYLSISFCNRTDIEVFSSLRIRSNQCVRNSSKV